MTSLVHGGRAAESAEEAAAVLFGGDPYAVGSEIFEMLAKEIPTVRAEGATDPLALLVSSGIVASNSEARRLISQRGLRVNGEVLEDGAALHSTTRIHDRWVLLRKGKSTYALIDLR
jgi:tyrosyl-tRNA synthetase